MKTKLFPAAFAAALALPLSAWGQYGVTGPVYYVPPTGPAVPVAQPPAAQVPPAMIPGGQPVMTPRMAPRRNLYSFDLRGFYGFRAVPHSVYATDMTGMEAEFAWYFTPRQALTLGASFGVGGNDEVNYVNGNYGPVPVSEDFTRSDGSFTVGYRFTQALTPRTSLSFGIKGGLDIQHLSYENYWDCHHGYYCDDDHSYGETRCGFAYAASITLEHRVSQRIMLQAGYQFRGATTKPDAPSIVPGGPSVSADSLRWHEVHLGLRFVF